MPRDLSSDITTELSKTAFALPIYCVRITRSTGDVLRWAEQGISFDDGSGMQAYEARLMSVSGLDFSPDQAGPVTFTVGNVDGLVTTLDRTKSFSGATFEFLAYLPGVSEYYLIWYGWGDEVQQLDAMSASLIAYPTVATPNVLVPKRVVGLPCTNSFANFQNWNSALDFDGSECPYSRPGSSVGFVAALVGDIDATTTSITAKWLLDSRSNGGKFQKGDAIRLSSEVMFVTNSPADPDGSGNQDLTVQRGYRLSTQATHGDNETILFANCGYGVPDCKRRGMYGNNPNDTYTYEDSHPTMGSTHTAMRNYFAGFPFVTGFQYGRFITASGQKPKSMRLVFSGNDSSYGRPLGLGYGRHRVSDPVLLIIKPEGDFLTSEWAVEEGLLATNPADNTQSPTFTDPNYINRAYSFTIDGDSNHVENIFINGKSRHDPHSGFGIEVSNGDQDKPQPAFDFFPTDPADFIQNNFGYWGTARVTFRISTKDNPTVDIEGQSVSGAFEVQYGRVHRVYTDATTFVLRATDDGVIPGANPSFVIMDVLASKRGGAGLDYGRLNIQSFVDLAAHCHEAVTSVFDGSSVKRWTFNGILDQRKSLGEWLQIISIGCYALPPYLDKNGKVKVRALKAEDTDDVPLFSSKVASTRGRNIVWQNNHSSLVKSRRPITEVPNEIRINYIDKSYDPGFAATLKSSITHPPTSVSDPVIFVIQWSADAITAGAKFQKDDKILIESEQLWILDDPGAPDGSREQTIRCQRAYAGTTLKEHAANNIIQFVGRSYSKISVVVSDRETQDAFGANLGDQSRRVLTKSIDLPGTTTEEEAARIGTLILRAGEFGEGGLSNNCRVVFSAFYRDAEDLEVGDIIEVEDDLLDPALNEQYFRVVGISLQPVPVATSSGIAFTRQITAVLHDNRMYDDTALSVSSYSRVDAGGPNDGQPPAVTDFSISEAGAFDANNKPVSQLTIDYVDPSPKLNYLSALLYMCNDDGSGNAVEDWRLMGEMTTPGGVLELPITGLVMHFALVSRALTGHHGDIDALDINDDFVYPRLSVLVDGVQDVLDAPTGVQAFGHDDHVQITWDEYSDATATTKKALLRSYDVYRNTVNDSGTATKVTGAADLRATSFIDASETIKDNPTTTYWYWVTGRTFNNIESAFSTPAHDNPGTDTAVPSPAPDIDVIREVASLAGTNDYTIVIGIQPPGSPTNYDTVDSWQLQISKDSGFSSTIFDQVVSRKIPDIIEFKVIEAGIYYIRALAINDFGNSSWSTTFVYNTNANAGIGDTDVPDAPVNLQLFTTSGLAKLAGNIYQARFEYPEDNIESAWGYWCFLFGSTTLPTTTKAASGTNGTMITGTSRVSVPGTPWTVGEWLAGSGYDLVYFNTLRNPASPDWELHGMVGHATIIANGTNFIDFDFPGNRQILNQSGNTEYWIVAKGGNNHFWEKLPAVQKDVLDNQNASRSARIVDFPTKLAPAYAFAAIDSKLGLGKLAGPSSAESIAGLDSDEIKDGAIITSKLVDLNVTTTKIADNSISTPKIQANAVTANEIDVNDLFAQTITATGSITGATLQTGVSGTRITIDSTNGLRAFNGTILLTQIPISGATAATLLAAVIKGVAGSLGLESNDGTSEIVLNQSGSINFFISGSGRFRIDNTAISALGGTVFSGSGASLTTLDASSVSSGTLADARLTSNVPLKNAANTFTAAQTLADGLLVQESSADRFQVDDADSSTQTAVLVRQDGVLRRVKTLFVATNSWGAGFPPSDINILYVD